uniref:Methenyltetrahydrofolate cyclohydrolase n=1 Tax=Lotharella oceanica TaxID=641309 RepID=A0A7S2XDD9_9EUKA|mmetsp:Transcript_31099/g.57987  ORF Transcript_31099/g.57987 Transcript_31099/m.57987 type:complete len:319 (+) Transcript_31099:32-988(+)|eukprot:CAMPEP_0170171360 /NCGR_PEP_ID=MMETSP0040_2-20121228/4501_1 /TAXON_ID=641309 /ORGANISM="Lotharella oceanica, Strain CCMP622" /LENGTH=318 /DNA_ID=CAMNT_0010411363 /DNA_START=30 /DNA_END=986 /DNA_ORIENTATION=+
MEEAKHQPVIIDGKATAKTVRLEIKRDTEFLKSKHKVVPGLATVLVGNRTDSATYVRFKKKAAAEVGFHSIDRHLEDTITEKELLKVVKELADDEKVHGILVQLPLPKHINEHTILSSIPVNKDVDGFSALNIGNLVMRGGQKPLAKPCTPWGCIELLKRYNIPISGKQAVVVGRSNIVGMPVAAMLQSLNATVTICHSKTKDLKSHLLNADIVVAAVGRAEYVKGDMIKKGATVIDVGINSKPDSTRKRGYRLVGDVDYAEAVKKAGAITPVPGGVGPMTIAMLLKNTLNLALHNNNIDPTALVAAEDEKTEPFPAS